LGNHVLVGFLVLVFFLGTPSAPLTPPGTRAGWLEEFIAELLAFPGRHDDQVDALTQGLAWGRERRREVYCGRVKGWY
jgi:hypothetical protein